MQFAKRTFIASVAAFVCMVTLGCGGSGGAPEAGVLDPGKKPGMSPVNKSGEAKGAEGKAAEAKPADAKPAEAKPADAAKPAADAKAAPEAKK